MVAMRIKKFFIAQAIFTNVFWTLLLQKTGSKKNSEIQLCPPNVAISPLTFEFTVTVEVSIKFGSAAFAAKRMLGRRKKPKKKSIRFIEWSI